LFGKMPRGGGAHCLTPDERREFLRHDQCCEVFIKRNLGSEEMIQDKLRYCLWIEADGIEEARQLPMVSNRLQSVEHFRSRSKAAATRGWADRSFRFVQIPGFARQSTIAVAGVSSERRKYLPVDLLDE